MDIKYVIRIPSPTTVNSAQLDLKNGTSQLADCFDFAFLPLFCFECALHRFNSSSRSAGSNRIGRLVFVAYDGVLTAFPSLFNTVNRDGNRIQIGQCYLSTNFGRSVSIHFFIWPRYTVLPHSESVVEMNLTVLVKLGRLIIG